MSTPFAELLSAPEIQFASDHLFSLARQGGTLYQVEQEIRVVLQLVGTRLLTLLGEAFKEREQHLGRPDCPCCNRPMQVSATVRRNLQFKEGILNLGRAYWECRPCKEHLFLLDRDLELPATGEITPGFGHLLCLLGVELPYESSRRLLLELTGREVDAGTIRKQILRDGQALVDLENQEAEICSQPMPARKRKKQLKELPALRSVPFPGETLVVEIDGVFANLGGDPKIRGLVREWEQEQARANANASEDMKEAVDLSGSKAKTKPTVFREVLNLRVYRLEDRVEKKTRSGKRRGSLARSETISVVNDPELFRKRAHAVLEAWKAKKYRYLLVLGDGGIFQRFLADFLQPTHEGLDLLHAKQHIHDVAKALWGPGTKEAKEWGHRWSDSVSEEGPEPLLEELPKLSAQEWSEEGTRKLGNLVAYVTEHRQRMRYPLFRQLGFPVGSGAIESANRQVVGDRSKRSGMSWSQIGLQALLSLRAALLSGNWEKVCAAIRYQRFHQKRERTIPEILVDPPIVDGEEVLLEPTNPRPKKLRTRSLVPTRKQAERIQRGLLEQATDGSLIPGSGSPQTKSALSSPERQSQATSRIPTYRSEPQNRFPLGAPRAP